jgi:hypothetical protein
VSVASARDGDFDPEHWYEKRKSVKEFVRELSGMVVAMWELHGKSDSHDSSQLLVYPAAGKLRHLV